MPRLFFWNVRHLSRHSGGVRKRIILRTCRDAQATQSFFCELTTQCDFPTPVNLTYRRQNAHQLCYGCLDNHRQDASYALQHYDPVTTPAYQAANFTGGNNFNALADRAVAYAGTVGNVRIYILHAPAGQNSARKAVAFVACHLNAVYGGATCWLLLGDLNVEPVLLAAARVGIQLGDLIVPPDQPTLRLKKYDYALCNFKAGVTVTVLRRSRRLHGSDHAPIVVEW